MPKANKKKIVMISGGFDPIHIGHIRYMQEAKELGDKLIVVINNDNWLKLKKLFVLLDTNLKLLSSLMTEILILSAHVLVWVEAV